MTRMSAVISGQFLVLVKEQRIRGVDLLHNKVAPSAPVRLRPLRTKLLHVFRLAKQFQFSTAARERNNFFPCHIACKRNSNAPLWRRGTGISLSKRFCPI